MIRPNYRIFRRVMQHSAKGSTWDEHKYIKRMDGTYYYPDSYEGGRHLPDGEKISSDKKEEKTEKVELNGNDVEKLAREVIRGNFGNGQIRKDLLGDSYAEVQKRVNEIILKGAGARNVSEASEDYIQKAVDIAKKVSVSPESSDSKVHTGIDIDQALSVYKKKK